MFAHKAAIRAGLRTPIPPVGDDAGSKGPMPPSPEQLSAIVAVLRSLGPMGDWSPLQAAIEGKSLPLVHECIALGALDDRDTECVPLPLPKYFYPANPGPRFRDQDERPEFHDRGEPLSFACEHGSTEMQLAIAEALGDAARTRRIRIHDKHAGVDVVAVSYVHIAAWYGRLELLSFLLDKFPGLYVESNYENIGSEEEVEVTPLLLALTGGAGLQVIRLLVDFSLANGINFSNLPLFLLRGSLSKLFLHAGKRGDAPRISIIEELFRLPCTPSFERDEFAICWQQAVYGAASKGRTETLKYLVAVPQFAPPSEHSIVGETLPKALFDAIDLYHAESALVIVDAMVAAGVSFEKQFDGGTVTVDCRIVEAKATALTLCCAKMSRGRPSDDCMREIFDRLIAAGADIDGGEWHPRARTPLHNACDNTLLWAVTKLLAAGARLDLPSDGSLLTTVAHGISHHGSWPLKKELVKLLTSPELWTRSRGGSEALADFVNGARGVNCGSVLVPFISYFSPSLSNRLVDARDYGVTKHLLSAGANPSFTYDEGALFLYVLEGFFMSIRSNGDPAEVDAECLRMLQLLASYGCDFVGGWLSTSSPSRRIQDCATYEGAPALTRSVAFLQEACSGTLSTLQTTVAAVEGDDGAPLRVAARLRPLSVWERPGTPSIADLCRGRPALLRCAQLVGRPWCPQSHHLHPRQHRVLVETLLLSWQRSRRGDVLGDFPIEMVYHIIQWCRLVPGDI